MAAMTSCATSLAAASAVPSSLICAIYRQTDHLAPLWGQLLQHGVFHAPNHHSVLQQDVQLLEAFPCRHHRKEGPTPPLHVAVDRSEPLHVSQKAGTEGVYLEKQIEGLVQRGRSTQQRHALGLLQHGDGAHHRA